MDDRDVQLEVAELRGEFREFATRASGDLGTLRTALEAEDRSTRQLIEFMRTTVQKNTDDIGSLNAVQTRSESRMSRLEADMTSALNGLRNDWETWREGFLGELRGAERTRNRITATVGLILTVLTIASLLINLQGV